MQSINNSNYDHPSTYIQVSQKTHLPILQRRSPNPADAPTVSFAPLQHHVEYPQDDWSQVTDALVASPSHPDQQNRRLLWTYLRCTCTVIEVTTDISPIVTVHNNFDVLNIPHDHVTRKPTDTFYINK
jgi:hypothetical protein